MSDNKRPKRKHSAESAEPQSAESNAKSDKSDHKEPRTTKASATSTLAAGSASVAAGSAVGLPKVASAAKATAGLPSKSAALAASGPAAAAACKSVEKGRVFGSYEGLKKDGLVGCFGCLGVFDAKSVAMVENDWHDNVASGVPVCAAGCSVTRSLPRVGTLASGYGAEARLCRHSDGTERGYHEGSESEEVAHERLAELHPNHQDVRGLLTNLVGKSVVEVAPGHVRFKGGWSLAFAVETKGSPPAEAYLSREHDGQPVKDIICAPSKRYGLHYGLRFVNGAAMFFNSSVRPDFYSNPSKPYDDEEDEVYPAPPPATKYHVSFVATASTHNTPKK